MKITYQGHSSFMIETARKHIYIDPMPDYDVKERPIGDLVLISGFDFEHYNRDGMKQVWGDSTIFGSTRQVAGETHNCRIMDPGVDIDFGFVRVKAVPAKSDHYPAEHLGFFLLIEGKIVYFTGETILMEEMKKAKADILITCIGGRHMMTSDDAAELAVAIKPKLVIPSHWGKITGTHDDALLFKEKLQKKLKTKLAILQKGEMIET